MGVLYRHSITVEFLARRPKKETPTPFAELRVVIFTKLPRSRLVIRRKLLEEVAKLAWMFVSIRVAVAQHRVTWHIDRYKEYSVRLPRLRRLMILTGFEYNVRVPDEEAIEYIAMSVTPYFAYISNPDFYIKAVTGNLPRYLNYPLYYAVFYDKMGFPKAEFNHFRIKEEISKDSATFTRASWMRGDEELYDFKMWRSIFFGLLAEEV
ncbi:MAG TPA: hypothetical protein ENG45_00940 [Candidatus Aenigmarchaeota archaeon]|nr:hypothetical protein [Candidatus Aenigmarchaeota archaeon]